MSLCHINLYAYNHENTRVSKTINAETTHFIYDGTPLAVISRHSVLDTESNKLYYIHTDHLGTPRRLADENGNIVWSWESDPIGFDGGVNSYGYVAGNPMGSVDKMEF